MIKKCQGFNFFDKAISSVCEKILMTLTGRKKLVKEDIRVDSSYVSRKIDEKMVFELGFERDHGRYNTDVTRKGIPAARCGIGKDSPAGS